MAGVEVYGADWCGMTTRSLRLLDSLGVDYKYINVEQDAQASAWVRAQSEDNKERKPTIKINAETILIEPSDAQLEEVLRANNLGANNLKNVKANS